MSNAEPQPWMRDANCHDVGPDAFYDWEGLRPPRKQLWLAVALDYCAGCLVRDECLAFALDQHVAQYDHGVWGGTTPEERAALRQARRTA